MKRMSLLGSIKVTLPPALVERIAIIDSHDFSGVVRKVREDNEERGLFYGPDWYEGGVFALKQYYVIGLIDGLNYHAVSDKIDPFWHAHILHTRQYMQFCNDMAGFYLHHEPLDHADRGMVANVQALYNFSWKRYDEVFVSVDPFWYPEHLGATEGVCCCHSPAPTTDTWMRENTFFPAHADGQLQLA